MTAICSMTAILKQREEIQTTKRPCPALLFARTGGRIAMVPEEDSNQSI